MGNMTDFMLDSLRELQTTLLILQARARSMPEIHEGYTLEWAIGETLKAYRDLKTGVITWQEAAQRYQTLSNLQLEVDNALMVYDLDDNLDWQMAARAARRGTA